MSKKKRTEARHIEALINVFPLDRWTIDTVYNFHIVLNARLCKVCDCYISSKILDSHIKFHLVEWNEIVQERKEDANLRRIEARKLKRESEKNENGVRS